MTINRITNTPIVMKSYNARGLTVQHSVTKNCVRQSDGTLWTVVGDYSCKVQVLRSADNGFTWTVIFDDVESGGDMRELDGLNADGLFAYLVIDERWRNIDVYMGEWESIGSDGSVERKRYNLDDFTEVATNTTVLTTTDNPWNAMFDICYNQEQAFLIWGDAINNLKVTRCSPRTTSISSDLTIATVTTLYNSVSSCCDKNGKVHVIHSYQNGSSDRIIDYIPYDSTTPSAGSAVQIKNFGAWPNIGKDLTIAIDGFGMLCAAWFHQNNSAGTVVIEYSISTDSGATWGTVQSLSRTSGHAAFQDTVTTDYAGRVNLISGSKGGFLLTYVEDNSDGTPRSYIRELTTSDSGATYDLQSEKEIGTQSPWTNESITGVQFFHPPGDKLLDISDPGLVRIAFTVGEGDSLTMSDTVPVSFAQELLYQSAYPTSLASESSSYSLDTADSISVRVLFDLLPGPNSNIDYYDSGLTGPFTQKYLSAFSRIGTQIRLLKYEPDSDNFMNDRSSYSAPTEENVAVLFDPQSYAFPTPSISADDQTSWIEKDVRKIFLSPDRHLERTFLVNQGGHLKRTVWTCEYDGNEYEISQIVPRFLSNQICYYEANAYVIGPSRDPWSRTILTSET